MVDAPATGNAVEYSVTTQPGKEYTVQFSLGGVSPDELIKVESRNVNVADPTTDQQILTYNSVSENGTYSIHFTAQSSTAVVRFLTEGVNGANFTIDDVKVTKGGHYEAVIEQASDYYPYGMRMKGRGISGKYAYGYQGSRSVDEIEGEGNTYTTEFRQLDSRCRYPKNQDIKNLPKFTFYVTKKIHIKI